MWLWLALAVLTVAAALAATRPLFGMTRLAGTEAASGPADLAVYKAQLAEVESDLERGVISAEDADAARIEVSRRLLNDPERSRRRAATSTPPNDGSRYWAFGAALALPLIALPLYLSNGAPGLTSRPGLVRPPATTTPPNAEHAPVAELVTKVEARLRARPDDGPGWDVVAPVYMKLERYDDARAAYRRAILLLGETAKRLSGLAEASIKASNDKITDEARDAFEKVLKLEPHRFEPRFWLALRREQDGDLKGAAEGYRVLLAAAPADAAWQPAVEGRLALVEAQLVRDGAARPAAKTERGPSPEAVIAAEQLSPADRDRMIQGMVDGLHARLKQDRHDAAGWQQLLRAYVVLGHRTKAIAALSEARQALAGVNPALGDLDAAAREMGLSP